MKRKRAAAFILCALLVSLFPGCNGDLFVQSNSKIPSGSSGGLTPEKGAILKFQTSSEEFGKAVAQKFKEKYGIEVTVMKGTVFDFQKAVLEGSSGQGPDIYMCPHDKTAEGVQAGLFIPINHKLSDQLNQDINPVAMKTVTEKGKVYGVPVSIQTSVLFYNKKLVKDAPADTFEQIASEAKSYNNPSENKYWFLFNASGGAALYPMMSTYGFSLFGANGTDESNPGFDKPEFEKGLEVIQKFHDFIPLKASATNNADFLLDEFKSGNTAYTIGGPWDVKTYRNDGVDFGVIPIPTYDGHAMKAFSYIQNAHVSAYSKYPNAAMLFAQFLASNDSAELLYSTANEITARKDISQVKGLKDDKILNVIVKAFGQSFPMPTTKRLSYFWTISGYVGPAVFDGTMTPGQGARIAQEQWKSFIKKESK